MGPRVSMDVLQNTNFLPLPEFEPQNIQRKAY